MKWIAGLSILVATAASAQFSRAPDPATNVTQAPNGAFVLGNPAAKVRLVEYLSYTCGHCAHFVGESATPLKRGYVARGSVAVEVRNAVRDRYDFAAALLARCGGPSKFFGNTEAIMASQPQWLGKAGAFDQANAERMAKMPINESLKLMARGVGLDAIMKARGITAAQMDVCLTDKAAQNRIVGMTKEAWEIRKINGTPAFLINGKALAGAGHWEQVETALKAALGAQ
jgi:protein-disulfide isomerase